MTVLASVRGEVGDYVETLTYVYVALIFVAVLMSFLPRVPYNRYLDTFLTFVRDVTSPYLQLFRRFLPMIKLGPGALDLSPMVGTFVLLIVGPLLADLIRGA
ncbi:MAG TPA: YggT family protein [Thermoleophilaceae bacterium]|nr:YggT family protein [Thermoleophilaceae bacterium]